ncbi:PREDICTED: pentatricopeptide repeat-containing protein At2g01860-like [Camelina sativa]|uniref:Pentatricopeptide repeat-containing protein At2g01860-like n=1 Tax=Camelina sativa TaxID=90675 RepID=A0ABM0ZCR3_CAMSA|nr:PREDICTED: pentatricopeptide repeat-containing protein At2g01860-like [Camelina sativa]XP_010513919.1 PREDICTED: pentatricopeptide repeat-containing protein At2g01860-like [Camelina sativa]
MILQCPVSSSLSCNLNHRTSSIGNIRVTRVNASQRNHSKKLTKNLRNPRRTKLPPDFGVNLFLRKPKIEPVLDDDDGGQHQDDDDDAVLWETEEIEAISSLFQKRIPQKPGKPIRVRPLPLPRPHKLRPLGLPTPKKNIRSAALSSVSKQVHKDPSFLIGLAREIKSLPSSDADVSLVLNKWVCFLRKGSLSMTIRELGHMGLPERALQTYHWAGKHSHLVPDNRILASTIQVLAKHHELKLLKFDNSLASKNVIEAMIKGCIEGGWLNLARKLILISKSNNRILDSSVYVKMILEIAKNPDKYHLVVALLEELKEREDLRLSQQDCTGIMKICVKLGEFELVESLFDWFKESNREPSVVMYTTMIHSRYSEEKYREAMNVVWEMEESNCLLDLPAYRVVIRLFVALDDLGRAVRYYSKLKEAGFLPTYDIYRDMISLYTASGRLTKGKEISKEVEDAGFRLDKDTSFRLLELEKLTMSQ